MQHTGRLHERVALITGTTGIGAATARLFAAEGARLVVVGRAREQCAELGQVLPDALVLASDLTEPGAADGIVAATLERYGRLDVLVNVAGISGRSYGDGPVHEASDGGWDAVMDTNAKTTFGMCRAALAPMLVQRSGAIVNIASVLAYAPGAEFFATHAYAASNGARLALTKAMAAYYAGHGIRVNAVAPGLIATPMSQRAQGDQKILGYIKTRQPLTGTLGAAGDVAQAVLYLASDASAFVTGVVLEVAGGWSVAG